MPKVLKVNYQITWLKQRFSMNNRLQEPLQELLDISSKMLGMAENSQWELIPEYEKQRLALARSIFKTPLDIQDSPLVASIIEQVLEINRKFNDLAEQEKADLSRNFQLFKKRSKINNAYTDNQ